MKEILKDTYCFYEGGKCSINCDGLHVCDACYDDSKLTPLCLWAYKDVVYGKEFIRDIDGDNVCKNHYHESVESEPDTRMTCEKCGFKTDSKFIMERHSCRGVK